MGEPFTTTLTVSLLFALVISLPLILYELYGFIVPALSPLEKRAIKPLLLAVPFLFAAGVLFGYFVVLPAAVRFFVNFNASEFNVLVQASQFYKFAATVLLAMGLVFQVPVVILGATRARSGDGRAAAQEPPLRDRGLRGDRRFPAGRRDHADARDGAAVSAVRGEYPGGRACGAKGRRARTGCRGTHGRPGAVSGATRAGKRAADHRSRRSRPHELMLFDLRGEHRRRAVKVIYVGLALLSAAG